LSESENSQPNVQMFRWDGQRAKLCVMLPDGGLGIMYTYLLVRQDRSTLRTRTLTLVLDLLLKLLISRGG